MALVTLARHAMATRFELVLHGANPIALRAAGEEALDEIDRLEAELSLFRPASQIANLNARAAREPVRITPSVFALLRHAQKLHQETDGAFDITIAPLVRCWGFMGGSGHLPQPGDLAEARSKVGMHLVQLDEGSFTVGFARPGVMLDLGAIGKGYAIECAAEILREGGVTSALLHGGTSTIYAIGQPPGAAAWNVAIEEPRRSAAARSRNQSTAGFAEAPSPSLRAISSPDDQVSKDSGSPSSGKMAAEALLATVPLRDEALSVSAGWGKSFQMEGRACGHVLDPRTGEPAAGALLAAVALASATETDALSTALLVQGAGGHERIARLRSGMRTLLVLGNETQFRVEAHGIAASPAQGPARG
jgi:thiamine biosynthesis lipoprotein